MTVGRDDAVRQALPSAPDHSELGHIGHQSQFPRLLARCATPASPPPAATAKAR
jgi:hypothetical protein